MRILLLYPQIPENAMSLDSFAWRAEPLGLEVLAAHSGDHDVKIQDLRFEVDLEETIASFKPHVVGVTCHITETYNVLAICRMVKKMEPTIFTFVGGHFPTMLPSAFDYPFVDVVIIGEAERTWPELIQALEKKEDLQNIAGIAFRMDGKQVIGEDREIVHDLNSLPVPRRDLVNRRNYNLFLDRPHAICEFTRGCANRCYFCSVHRYGKGKYRTMNVERILMELEGIDERTIAFIDDNFFFDLNRAELLAKEIARSHLRKKRYFLFGSAELVVRRPDIMELWRRAGLKYFYMGVEGVGYLDKYNKPVSPEENRKAIRIMKDLDIHLVVSIIIDPDFDGTNFEEIIDYIESNGIDYPLFPILTPFPGSKLYDDSSGRIMTKNYALYDFLHSVFETRLPREEFYRKYSGLYRYLGSPERRWRVRKRTLMRAFRNYRPWEWPSLMADSISFLRKWRELGKRLADPEAYMEDDLKEPPSFSLEEDLFPSWGCSRGRRSTLK